MPNRPRPRPDCIPGIGRDPTCARAWSALARTRARQDAGDAPGNGDPDPPTPTPTPSPDPVFGALSGWSSDDYLSREAAVWPGQVPFLMSIWAKRKSGTSGSAPMLHVGQTLGANHSRHMLFNPNATATERLTGAGNAVSTASTVQDQWDHCAAAFVETQVPDGTNLREAWVRGANKGTNTTNAGGAGLNAPTMTAIGPIHGTVAEAYPDLAEASVWDIAGFSEANRQALVTRLATRVEGLIPSAEDVNADEGEPWTGKLVAYWPLFDLEDGLLDHSGNGHHMTASGSLTVVEDHPNL